MLHGQASLRNWTYVSFGKSAPLTPEASPRFSDELIANIPAGKKHRERYALIIGNEAYGKYRLGLPDVAHARSDARAFRSYAMIFWGIPDEYLFYLEDGTAVLMRAYIGRLTLLLKTAPANAEVFFYFAGHGLPDQESGSFVPAAVDEDPFGSQPATTFLHLVQQLGMDGALKVLAITDACFTGSTRDGGNALATRGARYVPVTGRLPIGLVHLAASRSGEYAFGWDEKKHGLFTQVLLDCLRVAPATQTWGIAFEKVRTDVMQKAARLHFASQEPVLSGHPFTLSEFRKSRIRNLKP